MPSKINATKNEITTDWYISPDIYALEQKLLFANKLIYVGHELMIPKINDYRVLPNNTEILMHNKNGIEIISNICRHHQALMLEGCGNSNKIVCPIHMWCYNNEGALLKTPLFSHEQGLNLPVKKLKKWNGLLFAGDLDPSPISFDNQLVTVNDLNFTDYVYSNSVSFTHNFNWKVFIDNYLDDYHVRPFHPGLRNLVDCNQIEWLFGKNYSNQKVGIQRNLFKKGPEAYRNWHQAFLDYRNSIPPEYGAVWFLLYPNIMIEHYPEMLTISVAIPDGPEHCINTVDFFYPKKIMESYQEIIHLSQIAYQETAKEDDTICDRIFRGKKSLAEQSIDDTGPYQLPSEAGILPFHHYLLSHLDAYLK